MQDKIELRAICGGKEFVLNGEPKKCGKAMERALARELGYDKINNWHPRTLIRQFKRWRLRKSIPLIAVFNDRNISTFLVENKSDIAKGIKRVLL